MVLIYVDATDAMTVTDATGATVILAPDSRTEDFR
jgi:hypothetical protein